MRKLYKILRNIIVSLLLTVAGLYVLLYIAVLLPPVQDFICRTASQALSDKTGGKIEIAYIRISPFNELELYDVSVCDPQGLHLMNAENIGAGISLGKLIFEQRVVVTFAEINGLDAHIWQKSPDAPLNIQFLIDAFKSKEKKEPTKFDLVLNNVILRNCKISYDRLWMPASTPGKFDANHIRVSDLSADLRLPVLKNDEIKVDLRRLTFRESSGLTVNKISSGLFLSQNELTITNPIIEMPGTQLSPKSMTFILKGWHDLGRQIMSQPLGLHLQEAIITPSDFACFVPALKHYQQTVWITANASYHQGELDVKTLEVLSQPGLELSLKGHISGLEGPLPDMQADFPSLRLKAEGRAINSIITDFTSLPTATRDLIGRLGDVSLQAAVSGSAHEASFNGRLSVAQGHAEMNVHYTKLADNGHNLKGKVLTKGFELGSLLDKSDLGLMAIDADADLVLRGKDISGTATIDLPLFTYKGYPYTNINVEASKHGNHIEGAVHAADPNLDFDIEGAFTMAGIASNLDLYADVRTLNLSAVNLGTPYDDMSITGVIEASLKGNDISNIEGYIDMNDIRYSSVNQPEIVCSHLNLTSERGELPHSLTLTSDYVDVRVSGEYDLKALPKSFKELGAYFLPDIIKPLDKAYRLPNQDFEFDILVKKDSGILEKIKSPIGLFEDLHLTGSFNSLRGVANLNMNIPYMSQGKSRLIRDTKLSLEVDTATNKCLLQLSTMIPSEKGDIRFNIDTKAAEGKVQTDIFWDLGRKRAYKGNVGLNATFGKNTENGKQIIDLIVNKSQFEVNDTVWHIDPANIRYTDKSLSVEGLKVHRDGQYALIEGTATASPQDSIKVSLNDIDLDYIFETLAINYVQFGGSASGTLTASSVFTKSPVLRTDNLVVGDMTYNHCVLGDAYISSHWDMERKAVALRADIRERDHSVAKIYGDIFAEGDSLSLFCEADKVNVAFLQPFMSAFCSDVQGRASGKVHLYGTFKDIDLTGRVFADTLRMKIDVLNTYYTVRDSVRLDPGRIIIKDVTVRDRNGHTALLNGDIRHEYFHNPSFDFAFTQAKDFLCYDTNAAFNPIWYGTIYGNGSGTMHGVPGFIDIRVDITTAPGSAFTFVLSDTEEAESFEFLTFTDKRKEALEAIISEQLTKTDDTPQFLKDFEKKKAQSEHPEEETRYAMDIRVSATPSSDLTIVMDPVAGDKIKANGEGSLRMYYNSEGELDLYGTYTLTKGLYNFTLQDVIVRDFKIRDGSKITFTGDPLGADLDITAAYRVNTSLTDLDKSFADDRELNRTNVPVEALLKVSGPMQSPDITFDIELPTLTEDVARKVKSIVSTSDMMNRQIVYLLALNRFYTPDYMSTTRTNNELASVASTTISTQLSNMLGELTPGWSFSPYFRTDKGDFSDMEVDLALSSSLLNNRLILNGNLGYRDKATSSTTFIGDFDIEYLLNNSGTLRLKAYNHFNDQNYYLRSALTTQGVGIIFKRDFKHFLPGIFRRHKKQKSDDKKSAPEKSAIKPKETPTQLNKQ